MERLRVFLMRPLKLHKHREEILWILKIFPDEPTDAILRYSTKRGLRSLSFGKVWVK